MYETEKTITFPSPKIHGCSSMGGFYAPALAEGFVVCAEFEKAVKEREMQRAIEERQ